MGQRSEVRYRGQRSDTKLRGQGYLHLGDVGEVSRADVVLSLQDGVDLWQAHDKLLLLLLPPKQRGHLLLQVADDVGVYLQAAAN